MIHELRIYRFHQGTKATFLREFRKAQRFMAKYGITFVAAWESDREDEFVWLRSFDNARARDQAIEAYYSSPEWLKIVDALRATIKRREVRILKGIKLPGSQL